MTTRRLPAAATLLVALLALAASVSAPSAGAGERSSWVRVQFDDRIAPGDRAAVDRAGLTGVQYAPRDAYVGYATAAAAERLRSQPGVVDVRALRAAEKVDAALSGRRGIRPVTVIGVVTGGWRQAVASVGRVRLGYPMSIDGRAWAVEADLPASAVAVLAARPDVLYVGPAATGLYPEDEGATQILANNIPGNRPVPGYEPFLVARGLDGSGVTMTIADDGLDPSHPELFGRIARRISYGPAGAYPAEGHGTHVAGIAGGMGADVPGIGRVKDADGLLYGIGVAPKMTFVDQNVIELVNSQVNPPRNGNNLRAWVKDGIGAGSYGWNASWHSGEGTGVGYITNAAILDVLTRDGDPDAPGNQPFTMIFSAGNAGSGARTITSPKEAKNIITVGSSLGHRAGSINTISSFSSRGPGADGRILPTVTAPGSSIVSARAAMGALCTTSPPSDGYGLYSSCSGTSMAAPQVTGSVALIVQWWRREHGEDPSTAMSKALLVNTATDMGAADIPNGNEGWGRVNLASLFDPDVERVYVDQSVVLGGPGQSHGVDVVAADPTRPLKVSLVWTDAPGAAGANPALVNDLDLTVTAADGTPWRGNFFVKGVSVSDGPPDRRNNVENVFIAAPGAGPYRVDVSAFNVPGDGVPGHGSPTDQDFALVISNARVA